MRTTGVSLILRMCHDSDEMEIVGSRNGRRVGRVFGRMKEWMFEFF
jgi:hypothetical protein